MSTEQETDKIIKDRIHDIFPDQLTAERIVNLVVTKKPPGWAKNSTATYYNEFYGKWMKKAADIMLSDKEDKMFRFNTFCGVQRELMSEKSLYTRINQSRRFLLDYLDTPEKLYLKWFNATSCENVKGVGVMIKYRLGVKEIDEEQMPDSVIGEDDRPNWRRRMEDWIESDEVKPFQQDNLILTPDEILSLKKELALLVGIMASVTSSCIKIIKNN